MINFESLDFKKARYERKFVISNQTLKEIEKIIKYNPFMFSEVFYKRNVNNIYLDSMSMKNYANNVIGNSQRLKIRIRWYGELFGLIKKPVLELKIKNSDMGRKLTFPLKQFILTKNFSREILQKEVFDKSNLPNWLNEGLKLAQLSLLNCYERKYFLSSNKIYRISLDDNLIFFEIKNKTNFFRHKIKDKQSIILELKYNKEYDDKASEITQSFPFRMTKSSKYTKGIDFLKY